MTSFISDYIPILQLNTAVTFPTQRCLFHINQHSNQYLFKEMIQNPYQHHYALCLFYSQQDKHYYDYGIMVKINHVEHSSDIQHSVIQAYGLFRVRIHQLLQEDKHTYISYVTRLEDMSSKTMHRSISTPSTTTPMMQPQPKPMSMARPCTLKLSYSVPPERGIYQRNTWTSAMQFHPTPPAAGEPNIHRPTAFIDDLKLKTELDQRVQKYLKSPDLLMKYECYSEKEDAYIWWLCTILPLHQTDKIHLFSLLSQRERIIAIIKYMDKLL
jgi:ATP-dependent Lon protease